jgi:hypothetical protein
MPTPQWQLMTAAFSLTAAVAAAAAAAAAGSDAVKVDDAGDDELADYDDDDDDADGGGAAVIKRRGLKTNAAGPAASAGEISPATQRQATAVCGGCSHYCMSLALQLLLLSELLLLLAVLGDCTV